MKRNGDLTSEFHLGSAGSGDKSTIPDEALVARDSIVKGALNIVQNIVGGAAIWDMSYGVIKVEGKRKSKRGSVTKSSVRNKNKKWIQQEYAKKRLREARGYRRTTVAMAESSLT